MTKRTREKDDEKKDSEERRRLTSAQFRMLNEELYTSTSEHHMRMFAAEGERSGQEVVHGTTVLHRMVVLGVCGIEKNEEERSM